MTVWCWRACVSLGVCVSVQHESVGVHVCCEGVSVTVCDSVTLMCELTDVFTCGSVHICVSCAL